LICGITLAFAREKYPELVIGQRVVAAISLVGEDARDGASDERLPSRVSDERSNTKFLFQTFPWVQRHQWLAASGLADTKMAGTNQFCSITNR
jgi:hypothetical protein